MESLITSCGSTEINYMSLNELINTIYNFDFGTHTNLNLFSREPFPCICLTYKLMKCAFVSKDATFIYFSLHLILPEFSFSSWLSWGLRRCVAAGLQQKLHESLFWFVLCVQAVCAFVSLLRCDFVTRCITYILFIRFLSSTVGNQAFDKCNDVWATRNNWTKMQFYLPSITEIVWLCCCC